MHPSATRPHASRHLRSLTLAAALAALTACGGGDSSSADATAATPTVTILTQPLDSQVTAGGGASFSVGTQRVAQGYQWQRSTDGGTTWAAIAGATTTTLTLATVGAADNGHLFRVVISDAGFDTPSAAARLSVADAVVAPTISVAPADLQLMAGADATFSVTAAGTSLAYQWQRSSDSQAWTDIAGQTGAVLTLAAVAVDSDGLQLRVVVRNSAGSQASAAARLAVRPASAAPAINSQPLAVAVVAPAAATFSVAASGRPTPGYQWQRSTDGGATFTDIAGATGASYSTGPTSLGDNGHRLRVLVSNSAGSLLSQAPTLSVSAAVAAPAITVQPQDQSVAVGQTVTLTTTASGTPTPTLQWQLSTDGGSTWANINGATGASYGFTASAGDDGRRYRSVASNSSGQIQSQAATVDVQRVGPVASAAGPYSASIGTSITLDGSASSSGISGPSGKRLTYAWTILAAAQGSRAILLNETTASPSFVADVSGAYSIQLMITNSLGATATAIAGITVSTQVCTPPVAVGTPDLAQRRACFACHAIDKKLVGPSFKDIAAKYRGTCNATAQLAAKIQGGGVGVWGQVPMPPNPQVSAAEAEDLASYILAF